jgi:hypothetical protein
MSDITRAIDIMNGRAPSEDFPELPGGFADHRWVIAVSVAEPNDHPVMFEQAFRLVVDAVTALRNATGGTPADGGDD